MVKSEKAPAKAAASGSDDSKLFAVLAYLLGIIGFLIVLLAKREDKFAMYHAKQSLVISIIALIIWIPGSIIASIFFIIPIIGWVIGGLLWLVLMLLSLVLLVFVVIGIINAINMRETPLPIIGRFGEKFNF